jgi:predicted dithiol-disulfide oxidoreductase (DUF899 family)
MTEHTTGTREAWLAARRALLAAEKEHTRRLMQLDTNRLSVRAALAAVPVSPRP